MNELKDSGNRREFASGAVRDISVGKGRCDLLALDVASRLMGDNKIVGHTNAYVETGNTTEIEEAIKVFVKEYMDNGCKDIMAYSMLELAKHFEAGGSKYGERNVYLGQPIHCFIDSGIRHYLKHRMGLTDERHDRAFIWNFVMLVWTHHHRPECIDIKFGEEK